MIITAIVPFQLPEGISPEDVKMAYGQSAPLFQGMPGLVRKYYLHGADRTGGVYLWESREAAERMYSDAWRQQIADRFGAPPEIEYFDTSLVIDNAGSVTCSWHGPAAYADLPNLPLIGSRNSSCRAR
jgi:hypothetical protein